jgi:hypothetical protein
VLGLSLLLSAELLAANDLRDPTRPLSYVAGKAESKNALVLQSVLISDSRKVAVINAQRLMEGEVIRNSGGIQLRRIFPHSVELNQAGKRWRILLNKSTSVRRENIVKVPHAPALANESSEN